MALRHQLKLYRKRHFREGNFRQDRKLIRELSGLEVEKMMRLRKRSRT